MKVSKLPKSIQEAIENYLCEPLTSYPDLEVNELDPNDFLLGHSILIPNHNHDLRESNIGQIYIENLWLVKTVELLRGPVCKVYTKTEDASPSYIVFHYLDRQLNDDFHMVKF